MERIPEMTKPKLTGIEQRIQSYLPDPKILKEYQGVTGEGFDLEFQNAFPGARYIAFFSHREGKIVITPPTHPYALVAQFDHRGQYGSGVFEGMSANPTLENGQITGANIILLEDRINRMLNRSLPARGYELPLPPQDYIQAIVDYMAILGENLYKSPKNELGRAYIRPDAGPGMGPLGLTLKKGYPINAGVVAWHWPSYFPGEEQRVYDGPGLRVAVLPTYQRLNPIRGKHSSNYGDAGIIGRQVRDLGVDEALILGPYKIPQPGTRDYFNLLQLADSDDETIREALKEQVLSDGPGEELLAISDNDEILIPPMDVNRLGGTTAQYVIDHLAGELGLTTKEQPFTLHDLEAGKLKGLFYAGNAVNIVPIGKIYLANQSHNIIGEIILDIPSALRDLQKTFSSQLTGQRAPTYSGLLTPIDLTGGAVAKQVLDEYYSQN